MARARLKRPTLEQLARKGASEKGDGGEDAEQYHESLPRGYTLLGPSQGELRSIPVKGP